MSKFIAMLCAATMLVSSTSIVLADEFESEGSEGYDEFYEDIYIDDYYDSSMEDFYNEFYGGDIYIPEDDYSQDFDESYTNDNFVDEPYIDNSYVGPSAEIQVIPLNPTTTEKEDSKEETDTTDEIVATGTFKDVADDAYYAQAVEFCYERGLFNGMTDTEFTPDVTMTRGMFATVFARIQKADLTDVTLTFSDVKAHAYYASPIAWATSAGIMDGYNDTTFGPDDAITREQAAKMLYAYLKNVKNITITDVAANYADSNDASDWAKAAINANTSVGYLRTDADNKINPKEKLTRADACYAVASAIKLVEALEAEGLKDAEESSLEKISEATTTTDETHSQMSEIPEADKDATTEDFQPYPGTEYNPIDD